MYVIFTICLTQNYEHDVNMLTLYIHAVRNKTDKCLYFVETLIETQYRYILLFINHNVRNYL